MRNVVRGLSLTLLLILTFVAASGEQKKTNASQKAQEATQAVADAKAQGVVVGRQFDLTPLRAKAARSLLAAEGVGASCQVTCSGGKVAGIVCNVGEMCQCSCMGGGPDCSCRNSSK
jgi:hypothetical protein